MCDSSKGTLGGTFYFHKNLHEIIVELLHENMDDVAVELLYTITCTLKWVTEWVPIRYLLETFLGNWVLKMALFC